MYNRKLCFSLFSLVACMGLASNALAAPTVRVLGANTKTSDIKPAYVPVSSTAKNSSTTGAVTKKSTISKPTSVGQATIRPVKSTSISENTAVKAANTERFPTITSFKGAPTTYKTATTNTSTALQGVNEKLEEMSADLADLQDKIANEYSTTEEIMDEIDKVYYKTSEIDIFKDGIYVQINNLKEQIEEAKEINNDTIYDHATDTRKRVAIVDSFNPAILESNGGTNDSNN